MSAAPEPLPLRAALYCRISNDPTGRQVGVERQEADCRALVERLGWEVAEVLVDNDISAFNGAHRPAYERLLRAIEGGEVDAVVAYHPDRMYRRLRDLGRLTDVIERNRVEVRTVAAGDVDLSTASGRFTAQILAAAAEHEAARIGERVKMAFRANRAKGNSHGGPAPYGFTRTLPGEMVINEAEAEVIRACAARLLAGESQRGIVIDLNERGVPAPRADQWSRSTLRKLLYSPRVAGLVPSGEEPVAPANWPAILDRATWERVRALLDGAKRGRRPSATLLSGYLRCGRCGGTMMGHDSGDGRRDYRCGGEQRDRCPRLNTINAEGTEAEVVKQVLEVARGTNLATARAERLMDDSERLVREIQEDEDDLDRMAEDYGARRISRAEWLTFRQHREPRLKENRAALAALGGESPLPPDLLTIDQEGFDALTFDQKRALIAIFLPPHGVVIGPHSGGQKRFEPQRVRIPTWLR